MPDRPAKGKTILAGGQAMAEELVLTFHGIGAPPEGIPAAERPYWIGRDAFCRVLDQAAGVEGLQVVATFDDGSLVPPALELGRGAGFRRREPRHASRDPRSRLVSDLKHRVKALR